MFASMSASVTAFRSFAETDADTEADGPTAAHRFFPQENPDRLGRPPVFSSFSRCRKQPRQAPAQTIPRPRATRSINPPSPSAYPNRYGAPQYFAFRGRFQYQLGIENPAQKYWTPDFPAAYKSVP